MQIKNLLIFIIVSLVILIGWQFIAPQIWPPKAAPGGKEQAHKEEDKDKSKKPKPPLDKKPKDKAKPKKTKPPPRDDKAKKPEPEAQQFRLRGDPSQYHLDVVLTTRGAGVQSLTLNKFDGANEDGKDTGHLLELIPPDKQVPSFLFYHYPLHQTEDDPHPADTLGRAIWRPAFWDEAHKKWTPITDAKKAVTTKEDVQSITFIAEVPDEDYKGLLVAKTFGLAPGEYHLRLRVELIDTRKHKDKPLPKFRYQLTGAHGLPIEGKWYTSTTRTSMVGMVDHKGNLERSVEDVRHISVRGGGDRVPENMLGEYRIQYAGVATQFFASMIVVNNTGDRKDIPPDVLDWAQPTLEYTEIKGKILEISPDRRRLTLTDTEDTNDKQPEFVVDPHCQVTLTGSEDTLAQLAPGQVVYVGYVASLNPRVAKVIKSAKLHHHNQFDDITVRVSTKLLEVARSGKTPQEYLLYNGPVKVRLLSHWFSGDKGVDGALVDTYQYDLHLNTLTDYHSDNWFGRFSNTIHWTDVLIWCTNRMHDLLGLLHHIIPIYGVCIIMLTIMVRGLMFPISRKQAYLSMKMQALAPEMKKLQEKYKNDPQGKTQAMMELYRRHGVNPLGGCLPLILQMPIFLGLYYALQESIFFRLASFGWIDNLAAPDMLFRWGTGIPIISDPERLGGLGYLGPYLNLLPVLAVTLMIFQQKMLTPPPTDENQAFQQKIMKYMMIFFGLMFYKVAAGLCLYFIASSLWGLAERKLLPKRQLAGTQPAADANGPSRGGLAARPGPRGKKPSQGRKDGDGAFQKVRDWWADVLKQAKKK